MCTTTARHSALPWNWFVHEPNLAKPCKTLLLYSKLRLTEGVDVWGKRPRTLGQLAPLSIAGLANNNAAATPFLSPETRDLLTGFADMDKVSIILKRSAAKRKSPYQYSVNKFSTAQEFAFPPSIFLCVLISERISFSPDEPWVQMSHRQPLVGPCKQSFILLIACASQHFRCGSYDC